MKNKYLLRIVGLPILVGLVLLSCTVPDQPTYGPGNPDPNPTGLPSATVTAVIPAEGYLKEIVTIQGTGFDTIPEYNLVAFGKKVGTVISATSTELKVETPNIAGEAVKGKVAVKGSEFWSNEFDFTFKEAVNVVADDISWPMGVEADSLGNVYVGSANDGVIYKIASDGTESEFAELPVNGSIGWGPGKLLYACEQWEGKIVSISADGSTVDDYVTGLTAPIDFDWAQNGNMYIVENDAGIAMYDGQSVTMVAEMGDSPKCCRVFGNYLYVTEVWGGKIWRFEITDSGLGAGEIILEGDSPLGLEFDKDGTMYYTEAWETSLYSVKQDGSTETLFEEQLMTPMHYLTYYGKMIYIVYPGWGDIGEIMSTYVGVEQAPNYGLQ